MLDASTSTKTRGMVGVGEFTTSVRTEQKLVVLSVVTRSKSKIRQLKSKKHRRPRNWSPVFLWGLKLRPFSDEGDSIGRNLRGADDLAPYHRNDRGDVTAYAAKRYNWPSPVKSALISTKPSTLVS